MSSEPKSEFTQLDAIRKVLSSWQVDCRGALGTGRQYGLPVAPDIASGRQRLWHWTELAGAL